MRFTEHFNIERSQAELDFVDIPLEMDIPLFLDPYAISIVNDIWFHEANDIILEYFQNIITAFNKKDEKTAELLLSGFKESNETHLGYSKPSNDGPRGAGVGAVQGKEIYLALQKSKAAQSGLLNDFHDFELLVPNIGPDKISDILTRILKLKLIKYTQDQCELYDVPTVSKPIDGCWDHSLKRWSSQYHHLPYYDGKPIILVPKRGVRYYDIIQTDKYFHFTFEFLKAEHIEAQSSLVETLKNGRQRVTNESLEAEIKKGHPSKKSFLNEFTSEHPERLKKFKKAAYNFDKGINDAHIEAAQMQSMGINLNALVKELDKIEPGIKGANKYHRTIEKILTAVFSPLLRSPQIEDYKDGGSKRIDITYENCSYEKGFFSELLNKHRINSAYIYVECKNYTDGKIGNKELDQLLGRFDPHTGEFGFLVCRNEEETSIKLAQNIYNRKKNYVLILSDKDIKELVRLKLLEVGNPAGQVSRFLDAKLKELIFQAKKKA